MENNKPKECIYCQADAYFDSVLQAINQAKTHIDMEVYIFDIDPIGKLVSQALIQAAQRGVNVRLLVDGMGANLDFIPVAKQLKAAGALVRIHRPLPWYVKLWALSLSSIRGLKKFWYLLTYINQRNHRKLLIVDHSAIWLGSINVSQKHFSHDQGGENWRDTAIALHNIDTHAIQSVYNLNWCKKKRKEKKRLSQQLITTPFLLNFTRTLRQKKRKNLISRIASSQDFIWITNAYFMPNSKLLSALISASKKGVDVRIVLPHKSDVFFMPWVASYFYGQLLKANIRIYEYQAGILHAKTLIIDNWASIGSSNLNQRSLQHDLEIDYVLQTSKSITQLTHDFLSDISHSEEFCYTELSTKKPWQRYLGGLILVLFSYWL
ncbi:MAG: cardiolipin synthase [Oleiphilaceae bacterium]|jgi:cardiolipin synthase